MAICTWWFMGEHVHVLHLNLLHDERCIVPALECIRSEEYSTSRARLEYSVGDVLRRSESSAMSHRGGLLAFIMRSSSCRSSSTNLSLSSRSLLKAPGELLPDELLAGVGLAGWLCHIFECYIQSPGLRVQYLQPDRHAMSTKLSLQKVLLQSR